MSLVALWPRASHAANWIPVDPHSFPPTKSTDQVSVTYLTAPLLEVCVFCAMSCCVSVCVCVFVSVCVPLLAKDKKSCAAKTEKTLIITCLFYLACIANANFLTHDRLKLDLCSSTFTCFTAAWRFATHAPTTRSQSTTTLSTCRSSRRSCRPLRKVPMARSNWFGIVLGKFC